MSRHLPPRELHHRRHANRTTGQRAADGVSAVVGSWRFLIAQSALLALWLAANLVGFVLRWDPYPFILLNLCLSFQAAYAAPIVLMSQNRQAAIDREHAENCYHQVAELVDIARRDGPPE